MTLEDRFWSKVSPAPALSCWRWNASRNRKGYGQIRVGGRAGKTVPAHRLAYELMIGPIPEGLQIDHLCKVRECVNPYHLEPVPIGVNVARSRVGAPQRERTHCPAGHEYDDGNTYRWRGERSCKKCRRAAHQRWIAKKRREAGR